MYLRIWLGAHALRTNGLQALGLPTGTYGDTLNPTYDFMASWLSAALGD